MKLKTSAIYIAVLCVSLLLSFSSASAQKRKSASAPTPTPTLQGSYALINSAAATDTINNAIEASVRGMWPFTGKARDKLRKVNLPPPQQITISYTSTEVSITTDQSGLIQTSSDGRPFRWTKDGTKYDVSTRWVNGNLERIFKGGGGKRVNTYSISADGKTLTMQVFGVSTGLIGLTQPLRYHLDYKRN